MALDAVRAWAMFLGVVLHTSLSFMEKDYGFSPIMDSSRSLAFDVLVLGVHAFRMELFFFIAGYFAALLIEKRGVRSFARNRLLRLGVPLVLGGLVLIPLTNLAFVLVDQYFPRGLGLPSEGWQSTRSGRLFDYSLPVHLWFLIYLLSLSTIGVVVRALSKSAVVARVLSPIATLIGSALIAPWGIIVLAVPVLGVNLLMTSWPVDTPDSWIPIPRVLALYGVFFACGWVVHARRVPVNELGRRFGLLLSLALLVLLPALIALGVALLPAMQKACVEHQISTRWADVPAMLVQVLLAWCMSLGTIGLFNRLFSSPGGASSNPSPVMLYLSDASYWVYLVHLPMVYLLTLALHSWHVPAIIKFPVSLFIVLGACLATYHLFVRFTPIGELLNGKRERPSAAAPARLRA